MGTTSEKLQMLLRTKERQKAYLQQKYPLLDFDTIPFRAYLDLFQGRSYVPGLVAAWKTYGKRNDDADRDDLYDYSGNGRDIRLYNFSFSGMSGYGGYAYDESNIIVNSTNLASVTVKGNRIEIANSSYSGTICYAASIQGTAGQPLTVNVPAYRIRVSGLKTGEHINIGRGYGVDTGQITWNDKVIPSITEDGIYEIPAYTNTFEPSNETERMIFSDFRPAIYPANGVSINVTIEILPVYPGALVSDGIDDYGQCIKDFVLPDDFTVCVLRKILEEKSSAVAGKSHLSRQGSFVIDYAGSNCYSYGGKGGTNEDLPLFSYLTKTEYNGVSVTPGTGTDTEEDKVFLFTVRNKYPPLSMAFYDLRIYDHTLTAEELQTVKDEMMTDYENATGGV